MGERGPAPKPTNLLATEWRKQKRDQQQIPIGPAGRPDPPAHMRPGAREIWDRLVPILEEMSLLTAADRDALVNYCQAVDKLRECEIVLRDHGLTYDTFDKDGILKMVRMRPEAGLSLQLTEQVRKLGAEFGLSPSARVRLAVEPADTSGDDKIDKFFTQAV